MTFTRTFEDFAPPRRYDGLPFTAALIRESATQAGTYSTIDTKTLAPVDVDPTAPASRDFTTALATLAAGWYVIRWQDAAGAVFDSDPVYYPSGVASPTVTVEEVLRVLRVDAVSEADNARLVEALQAAESWARKYLRWPSLGVTEPVTESFYSAYVVPVSGTVTAVYTVAYPGADRLLLDPSLYLVDGGQLQILATGGFSWPGLPADERVGGDTSEPFRIDVESTPDVAIDPAVRRGIALAAAALWYRGPRTGKGLASESLGDYSYSVAAIPSGDPFFSEAKVLLRPYRRIHTLVP